MDGATAAYLAAMNDSVRFLTILGFISGALGIIGFFVAIWFTHRLIRVGERLADQAERLVTKLTICPPASSDELRAEAARRVAALEGKSNPFGK